MEWSRRYSPSESHVAAGRVTEMGLNPALFPEHVKRCMSVEDRALLGVRTAEEGIAVEDTKAEREIQDEIYNYLSLLGIEVSRAAMHKRSTIKRGWSDMTFCFHGVPCVLEVKTLIGQLSPAQKSLREKLIANGWHYGVVHSIDETKQFLSGVVYKEATEDG